jgi:ACS family hexuronate transporter-like MFS transporter
MPTQKPPADALAPDLSRRGGVDARGQRERAGAPPAGDARGGPAPGIGRYRWTICALLFFATTINYIDRSVLGILAPTLQDEIGWSEREYGSIVGYFTLAYGLGFLFAGRVMDRIGVKRGFAGYLIAWSAAAMSHALARTPFGFGMARFALGLGESGNFPAAVKTVAEWFPRRERSFATGVFNAGSNVGAILTPLIVPWLAINWGWRTAFIATGALGLVWLLAWFAFFGRPEELAAGPKPRVSAAELAYIRSDAEPAAGAPDPWSALLQKRQAWAFIAGKFLTDGVWWFYLFWLPKFLDAEFGVRLGAVAAPLIVIYLMADVGSVAGGWLGTRLQSIGWTLNRARKTAMLVPALLVMATVFTPQIGEAGGLWAAVAIVSVAAASHQAWSANLFTLTSDMFPRRDVGSVVGMGGAAGALGGWLFQQGTGYVLETTGSNYSLVFVACGFAYVTALAVIHLLVPRLQPAKRPDAVAG